MTWISKLIYPSKKMTMQAFGKLPFYKDFITFLTLPEAKNWQAWLLNESGLRKSDQLEKRCPYIYQKSPSEKLILGIIEPSSDGLRDFPFSLFVVSDVPAAKCKHYALREVWKQLNNVREKVAAVNSIDGCYRIIQNRIVIMPPGSKNQTRHTIPNLPSLFPASKKQWPVLMIFKDVDALELLLVRGRLDPK